MSRVKHADGQPDLRATYLSDLLVRDPESKERISAYVNSWVGLSEDDKIYIARHLQTSFHFINHSTIKNILSDFATWYQEYLNGVASGPVKRDETESTPNEPEAVVEQADKKDAIENGDILSSVNLPFMEKDETESPAVEQPQQGATEDVAGADQSADEGNVAEAVKADSAAQVPSVEADPNGGEEMITQTGGKDEN